MGSLGFCTFGNILFGNGGPWSWPAFFLRLGGTALGGFVTGCCGQLGKIAIDYLKVKYFNKSNQKEKDNGNSNEKAA